MITPIILGFISGFLITIPPAFDDGLIGLAVRLIAISLCYLSGFMAGCGANTD